MSQIINNREYRQKCLKELMMELHEGKSVEEVKSKFADLIEGVSPAEISEMEQALIQEGMPVQEIQRLCDVHAAVFKGSIEQIHHPEETPGHPVHTFRQENIEIEQFIKNTLQPLIDIFNTEDSQNNIYKLVENINLLWDLDKHYSRKENLLFPYLEKYGINAPPKVMWGVDDEIRAELKGLRMSLQSYSGEKEKIVAQFDATITKIKDMIFKEENILFPMALETLSEDEWLNIESESMEIGYCLSAPEKKWAPTRVNVEKKEDEKIADEDSKGYIKFDTGILKAKEISAIFNTLPVDITFVDNNGVVKYFSQGKERIFPRTKAIIGRKVQNCHPPASVHVVETIVEDLMSGKKDQEDFWIQMGEMYILIRYFAIRDEKGEYLGTLEVSQNIKPFQKLEGEKRLLSE